MRIKLKPKERKNHEKTYLGNNGSRNGLKIWRS